MKTLPAEVVLFLVPSIKHCTVHASLDHYTVLSFQLGDGLLPSHQPAGRRSATALPTEKSCPRKLIAALA